MVRTLFNSLRRGFSFANVCSFLALFIALGTGTAYAANTVFSTDIVDGEVKTVDLGDGAVTSQKIGQNQVYTFDVRDDTFSNGGLTADDLQAGSVTSSELLDSTITGADVLDGSLTGNDISNGSLTGTDVANSTLTGSDISDSTLTGSDIENRTVNMDDIDGADRSGAISIGAISNGRCITITGSVSGARPGDVALLTTNGSIPSGITIYAQRALTDEVQIKVCNLSGATSAAITDLPVRVITLH